MPKEECLSSLFCLLFQPHILNYIKLPNLCASAMCMRYMCICLRKIILLYQQNLRCCKSLHFLYTLRASMCPSMPSICPLPQGLPSAVWRAICVYQLGTWMSGTAGRTRGDFDLANKFGRRLKVSQLFTSTKKSYFCCSTQIEGSEKRKLTQMY